MMRYMHGCWSIFVNVALSKMKKKSRIFNFTLQFETKLKQYNMLYHCIPWFLQIMDVFVVNYGLTGTKRN